MEVIIAMTMETSFTVFYKEIGYLSDDVMRSVCGILDERPITSTAWLAFLRAVSQLDLKN